MELKSVDTTPNPNSMKLNLGASFGMSATYTREHEGACPEIVDKLLAIEGVKSVFVCNDFITLNRDPRVSWQPILASATAAFSHGDEITSVDQQRQAAEKDGQAAVMVQTFRGVPIQVKVVDTHGERRLALAPRFNDVAQFVQAETGADYLKERYWADWGIRYGDAEQVAAEVVAEIEGTLDDEALDRIKQKALGKAVAAAVPTALATLRERLHSPDWCTRLGAVQELGTTESVVADLADALNDSHPQVRRLAAAALGASGAAAAVEPLCRTLESDPHVGVRRTAGDALSDLGDVSAQDSVCRALSDENKLVRWRSARFLAEIGTPDSLPYLESVANDPEFEVRLEVQAAMQRIRGGGEGVAPAWKRILERE